MSTPPPILPTLLAGLLLGSCSSSAFLNMDPWPGSMKEQQSDAWLTGGRYGTGAIVASDSTEYMEDEMGPAGAMDTDPASTLDLGGLQPTNQNQGPLLTWDGDVIDGPERGAVVERDDPTRGLEASPGGRTYLLQLYQDVLDERDHLEDEVRALRKALGEAQARIDDTSASTTGLSERLDGFAAEIIRLEAENEDLAARLATTQIRRLEAEKMLLEARIDWYRLQDETTPEELMAAGPMTGEMGTQSKPMNTGSKP